MATVFSAHHIHDASEIDVQHRSTERTLVGNKASAVCDLIVEHRLDVLCVVESWHNAADTPSLIAAMPPGYCYVEKARPRRAGKSLNCNHGGICIFIRSNFKVRYVQLPVYKSFEALLVAVHHGGISLSILTIYRPPPAATDEFFREFGDALELCSKYTHCYVVGDVNIHLDKSSSLPAEKFSRVVSVFGLRDCVGRPTHDKTHQLDVFLAYVDRRQPSVVVYPPMLSDHSLIVASLDAVTGGGSQVRSSVRRRKWATFTRADFINALNQSALVVNPPSEVDEFFACYDKTISSLLNRTAPFIDVKSYSRTTSPWYDRDCHNMKLQTRRLEKAYRRRPSVTTLSAWRSQFQRQRALLQRKFSEYWSHAISSTGNDTKALWQKLKCLLSQPSTVHSHFLADQFL